MIPKVELDTSDKKFAKKYFSFQVGCIKNCLKQLSILYRMI